MDDAIAIKIACALCHLVEFHDTGEPLDLQAYAGLLAAPDVAEWLRDNQVLLPARRDAVAQHAAL